MVLTSVWRASALQGLVFGVLLAAPPAEAQQETAHPVVVETAVAGEGSIREFEFAQGTVQASRREFLVFENSGKVNFIKTNAQGAVLREGDPISDGQLLATLESATESASIQSARSSLEAARAGLRSAQSAFERAENLKAGGAISERDYERAVTSLEDSRARVDNAEASLVRSTSSLRGAQLVAPFDGVVAFMNISEGQYISQASFNSSSEASAIRTAPLVVIDPESFEIRVDVPAFVGERLAVGQTAFVLRQETLTRLQSIGAEPVGALVQDLLQGNVTSVSPAIYPEDRSIRTRIRMQADASNLRDGEHVTVWLQVGLKQNAIVLPANAVATRNEQSLVFVVDDNGRVMQRRVEVGLVGLEGVEVLNGVNAGERVITVGKHRVRDGDTVTVTRSTASE